MEFNLTYQKYVYNDNVYDGGIYVKKKRKNKAKEKQTKDKAKKQSPKNSFIRNIPIGFKYLSVFLISIILFIAATVVVYFQLSTAKNNVTDSIEKNQITNDMTQLALFIEQQDSIVANYMIVGSSRYEAE